jgi:hypothetical protein
MINISPFDQVDEATISNFEKEIGFPLPEDYRSFLKKTNGGKVNKQVFFVEDLEQDILLDALFGINTSRSRALELRHWINEFKEDLQEKTLIIGTDPGGRFITYITAGEDKGVYYWDHNYFFEESSDEEGNTYFVSESFNDFVNSLKDYQRVQ